MNSADNEHGGRARSIGAAVERAVEYWALAGGGVLIFVVLVNIVSVLGGIFWRPLPGDFEITEVGVAVAAFAFLPYCQVIGANVTADIFTAKLSGRWIGLFKSFASVAALLFSSILLWRMFEGMLSQREYGYTTAIIQFPVWIAYIPILVSLALLIVAAVHSLLSPAGREPAGTHV